MEWFTTLQDVLYCRFPQAKIVLNEKFYQKHYLQQKFIINKNFVFHFVFQKRENFFEQNLFTMVLLQELLPRKQLQTLSGVQKLIHAILHSEKETYRINLTKIEWCNQYQCQDARTR